MTAETTKPSQSVAECTPIPWQVNTEAGRPTREVFSGDILVADCGLYGLAWIDTEANAQFIVRAVNNFDALLRGAKEMREAAAACFRVIASVPNLIQELEKELHRVGISDGFGERIQEVIKKAELP
jgi:hypothetical protein